MTHLFTFGTFTGSHQGRELGWLSTKWVSAAVLLYLAIERRCSRDSLQAVFWPDADAATAGHRLNQALYTLRRELGNDAVLSSGAQVIASSSVSCDAGELEQLIESRRWGEAVLLYTSPFLAGVHLTATKEFEDWVDSRRARYARLFRTACRALLEQSLAAGDFSAAIEVARRWTEPDPLDDDAQHQLIETLWKFGDRHEALTSYETYRRLLAANSLTPPHRTEELIAHIRAAESLTHAPPALAGTPQSAGTSPLVSTAPIDLVAAADVALPLPRMARRAGFVLALGIAGTATLAPVLNRLGEAERSRPDPNVVAVLPFRVSGADPQLDYLREGMVDLLAAKLGHAGEMRAVDSRTVLAAWRRATHSKEVDLSTDAAVEIARSLGSGRLLLGEIVGTPSRVVFTATLFRVPAGRIAGRATAEGPADSLIDIVDRLAVQLLALQSEPEQHGPAALKGTPFQAIKLYLEGRSLYRRGNYRSAIERFEQALEYDSTFALAAMGLAQAGGWVDVSAQSRGLVLAWSGRERLSARDHADLVAMAGKRYPLPPTGVEQIEVRRALLRIAPDQPEAWYSLGDALFHNGRYVGEEAPEEQAIAAFQEAIRLDSAFAGPMHHLIDLLAARGDNAAVRRLGGMYLTLDSVSETAAYLRWRVAAVLNDNEALNAFWDHGDAAPTATLNWILGTIQSEGVRLEDFDRALKAHAPRGAWWGRANALLNRGRPSEAALLLDRRPVQPDNPYPLERIEIFNALFWDGDALRGARAARKLSRVIGEPVPEEPGMRAQYFVALCIVERWRAWHGELETLARSIQRLRRASTPPDKPAAVEAARLCALELEAEQAVQQRRPQARRLVALLDSAYQVGPHLDRWTSTPNLSVARLLEALGDREGALAAVRRGVPRDLAPQIALSTFLREEGRLAALTGDRIRAIRAYRRYLDLRADPEPSLRPQVEQVRTELAKLNPGSTNSSRASRSRR